MIHRIRSLTFGKEDMHRLVVSVEVVDEISFAGQQSTGVETTDTSGDSVCGTFHRTVNGPTVGGIKVKV